MVTREEKIEQSLQDYAKAKLFDVHGYDEDKIEVLDSFPYEDFEGSLDKNYIAFGFNYDQPAVPAEIGSNLKRRIYVIELFVFGINDLWGKNVAHRMKFDIESDEVVPLKDIGEPNAPVIDALVVLGTHTAKVIVPDPEPYQESIYLTTVRLEDTYYPDLV